MFRFSVYNVVLYLFLPLKLVLQNLSLREVPEEKQLLFSFGSCEGVIEHELLVSQIPLILIPKELGKDLY